MSFLRGGGCGTSSNVVRPEFQNPLSPKRGLPTDFASKIRSNVDKIASLTETPDQVMNSLQYFFYNESMFQMLIDNQEYAGRYVDLLQKCITDLLNASARLIKSNGLQCNLTMQIAGWMAKVLFWFYTCNSEKKRKIKMEEKKEFLTQVVRMEQQLEIENNIHETAIKYELYCIKMIFTIFPNDSDEGQKLAIQFLKGAIESIITMKISDNLVDSIKGGINFAANEGYKLYAQNQYHKIFQIEKLRWKVIDAITRDEKTSMSKLIKQLGEMYKQIISSSWEIHYCWIKSISAIICAKPIYSVRELPLNDEQLKQLQSQRAIIMIDSQQFLINLNVQKLLTEESQDVYRRVAVMKKIADLQLSLLNGNEHIPKFEQYGNKLQEAQEARAKVLTPIQYFAQLFQKVQFSAFIKRMDDIQKDILKLEQCEFYTTPYQESLAEQFQENVSSAKEYINVCLQKMMKLLLFYQQIVFIAEQWDLFVTENSDPALFQNQPFMAKLEVSQSEQIKLHDIFKFDYQRFKLTPQTPQTSIPTMSQNQLEFAIQFYLWQLVRMMQLHLNNIGKLVQIEIKIEFLSKIVESEHEAVPEVIIDLQSGIIQSVKEILQLPTAPAINLLEMLKLLNSVQIENKHRNFNILPQEVFNLHQVIQYDNQQLSHLQTIIKSYSEIYSQFKVSDHQKSNILTLQLTLLKYYLERLNISIQGQEAVRVKVVELFKTIQYSNAPDTNKFNEYQSQISNQLQNTLNCMKSEAFKSEDLLDQIRACIKVSSEQQKLSNNHYMHILELNPYDTKAQLDQQQEQQFIDDIQKNLDLILELQRRNLGNSLDYISEIIANMLNQISSVNSTVSNVRIKSVNNEQLKTNHEELIKVYEQQFMTLKNTLQQSQVDIEQMEQDLDIMKRVEQTCKNTKITPDWVNTIKQWKSSNFKLLISTQLKQLSAQYQMQLRVNPSMLIVLVDQIFPQDQSQTTLEKVQSFLNSDQIRIKECIANQLFLITDSCLRSNIKLEADLMILRMKTYEIDKKLRNLLNSPDYNKQVTLILQQHWPSQQEKIIQEVKGGLKDLNSLLYELQQVNDADKKKKLKDQYQIKENQIQEQLQNVTEIGSSLGITMLFIRDIKKDLGKIDEKINEIQETMKNMNNDISYLRGKTVYQLLEIRRNDILMNKKIMDAYKIYIKIKCIEKSYKKSTNGKQNQVSKTDDDILSKVDEFLEQPKTAMLMHGQAGSGKSTASRKIEEYLWERYERQSNRDCNIVPIVIQLPQLQDPQHSAMNETLKSEAYRFSVNQIRDLKEEISQQKIKLVIIMDSYDELAPIHRGLNLIRLNKLSMWGLKSAPGYPKIIVTTRSEILNKADYQEWFLPEEDNDTITKYKEIQLEKFNKKQREEYVTQYLNVSVKRVLYDAYNLMTKNKNKFEIFDQFSAFWDTIKIDFDKSSSDNLLTVQYIKVLQDALQVDKHIQINSLELQRTLQVQLSELKSGDFYTNTIEMMKIEHILETPFMMEIVVEVLPTLIKQKSQQAYVKRFFIPTYSELNQKLNQESPEFNDRKADEAWNELIQNHSFFEDFSITQTPETIKKKLSDIIKETNKYDMYTTSLLSRTLTQYDFYQSFFTLYFQREINKLKEHGQAHSSTLLVQELWRFAKELAVEMSKETKTQVEYKAQGLIYKKNSDSWEDRYFDDGDDKGKYKKMFRNCIPLKQQNNSYCFNHKSLQEFLVAKEFLKQMRDLIKAIKNKSKQSNELASEFTSNDLNLYEHLGDQQEINNKVKDSLMLMKDHFINQCSWSIDFMKGTCSFIIQKAIRKPELRQLMFAAVELTRVEKDMIFFGSNCLFLLASMGESFMDKDMKGIKIKSIDLSGANFAHCNLDDTHFTEVNVSGMNLFNSSLKNVVWHKIQVSQLPPIPLREKTKKMLYTREERLILLNDQEIQICSDKVIALMKSTAEIEKMFYYQDYIFALLKQSIMCRQTKSIPQIILNSGEPTPPTNLTFSQKIKRLRFHQNDIYCLTDDSNIFVYNLSDLKETDKKTLKIKDELAKQDSKNTFTIENFWPSDIDIMVHATNFYQFKLTQNSENFECKKTYYPKYRVLQTDGKIQVIDPTKSDQVQEESTDQKKQPQKKAAIQNNDKVKLSALERKRRLLEQKEQNKEAERQKELAQQGEKLTQTEIMKPECKLIKLSSDKFFLLWSQTEIEQYHINIIDLKQKKQQHHTLNKFKKKKISQNNKIMVTVHDEKVAIWDLDTLQVIHTLNYREVIACSIHQNDILTMSRQRQIIQQDLKSLTLSMQMNFRMVCFAQKSQNFVGETTDGNIYFFYHKGEIKSQLIMKHKSKFLSLDAQGECVVIVLADNKHSLYIWDSVKKEMSKRQYAYTYSNIKLRSLDEIYFMKGNQLYKLEQGEAQIISPVAAPIQKTKKSDKSNQKQQDQLVIQQINITKHAMYVVMNGLFMEYTLLKNIQQSIKVEPLNVTKLVICKNNEIYLIVNKTQILKKDKTVVYKLKEEIVDCIESEAYADLIIAHQHLIRRLVRTDNAIKIDTINIKDTKWLYNKKGLLFIGLIDRIAIYDLKFNDIIDTIKCNGIPKKMTGYFSDQLNNEQFAILVGDEIYKYSRNTGTMKLQTKYEKCQDMSFANDMFVTRCGNAFQYESQDESIGSFGEGYDQWNNIQIVIRRKKVYIYGIYNNQVVRQHINTEFKSNQQVMASLLSEYQNIRGYDISSQLVVFYNKSYIYIQFNKETKDVKENQLQKIQAEDGCKAISISSDDRYLLTSNLLDKIYLYEIKTTQSQLLRCITKHSSINKILFIQNEILINNAELIHICSCHDSDNSEVVAYIKNGFKEIGATKIGFNIVNKDSSIDLFWKQKYRDPTVKAQLGSKERYVRVEVFNPSSDQPINTYQNKGDGAEIKSINNFSLLGLFENQ